MSNKTYDENLIRVEKASEDGCDWYEVNAENFDVYGYVQDEDIITRRIPLDIAKTVSEGVAGFSGYGAGGRILFSTNSPFIALKVEYASGWDPTSCSPCFTYGLDLYCYNKNGDERDAFVGSFRPPSGFDYKYAEYKTKVKNYGKIEFYTVNMPHFAEIRKMYIGLESGSYLGRGKKYRNALPVVYYGSSITHGVAAGRPGNTYQNFISQKYNLDYVNLGFAGKARGETAIAEYIAGLDMCAFVCDYDHNAPSIEHLTNTHFAFYEVIRERHPDIPYIMVSKPDCFIDPQMSEQRKCVIIDSYNKARALGDKNVYFVDGATLFDGEFYESCTVDGCHPNDLGFYRMADHIGNALAKALGI